MIGKTHTKKWLVIALVALALVPILLTAFELIFTENTSVVFLGNYSPKVAIVVISYYVVLLGFGVYWFTNQLIAITQLKNEKAKTELMLLKSQVNPHFFFNMLNNVYGLVAKDSVKAQQLILKLSDMMRYSIYEGERETVPLKEEMEYVKNYVALHQMRYHKHIMVDFHFEGDDDREVAPLLFILLLENAFKHGVETLREHAWVKVSMISLPDKIDFTVANNFDPSAKENSTTGIGLKNLKRRLELTYPNKHSLTFQVTENTYQAHLILNPK